DWSQPTIGTFHGLMHTASQGLMRAWSGLAERLAMSRVDEIHVVNRADFEAVRKIQTRIPCVLLRAGFGCDLDLFPAPPHTERRREIRSKLGFDDDAVVGAYVGRLVDFKGIPVLTRAFRRVTEIDSKARLLLIGGRDPLHATGLTVAEETWLTS